MKFEEADAPDLPAALTGSPRFDAGSLSFGDADSGRSAGRFWLSAEPAAPGFCVVGLPSV